MNLKTKKRAKVPSKKNTLVKKSTATKKSARIKKNATRKTTAPATKKATLKKTILRKAITTDTAKQKIKRTKNKTTVETVERNLPPVEEKSSAVNNVIDLVPDTDMKSLQQKAVQNYDKHQIRLSSVKKGGPKPSGKKPLW